MSERDDLLDETTLRRALRFENDEGVPRFDVAAIAALASASRPPLRAFALATLACVVLGLAGAATWSLLVMLAPDVADAAIAFTVDIVVTIVTALEPLAEIAAQPVVPFSLLAALAIAIVHELSERREAVHANAS